MESGNLLSLITFSFAFYQHCFHSINPHQLPIKWAETKGYDECLFEGFQDALGKLLCYKQI